MEIEAIITECVYLGEDLKENIELLYPSEQGYVYQIQLSRLGKMYQYSGYCCGPHDSVDQFMAEFKDFLAEEVRVLTECDTYESFATTFGYLNAQDLYESIQATARVTCSFFNADEISAFVLD